MNLQIVLNTPKIPYLNQAAKKNTCQNFPTPKKSRIQNFKPKKTLRSSLSLEIWSAPPLGYLLSYKCSICLYVVNAIMLVVLISCSLQMCGTLTEK